MSESRAPKRKLRRVVAILAIPTILLTGYLFAEQRLLASARPPDGLATIHEFRVWMDNTVLGTGTFENSGTTYSVILGPSGRILSSGPSAYLFDSDGRFVDWTADMGDIKTTKHRFDLSGGRVKRATSDRR